MVQNFILVRVIFRTSVRRKLYLDCVPTCNQRETRLFLHTFHDFTSYKCGVYCKLENSWEENNVLKVYPQVCPRERNSHGVGWWTWNLSIASRSNIIFKNILKLNTIVLTAQ